MDWKLELSLHWCFSGSFQTLQKPRPQMTQWQRCYEFHLQKIANKIGPLAFLMLWETSNNPRAEFDAMCLAPDTMFYPLQEIPSVVISPMSNTSCSYEKCVGIPKKICQLPHACCLRKRVSHKSHLSSGRKTEKAPLERQVTFDPARIVPWGSPAGSRKPTKETAGKHALIEAKNFTKHQKFQPFTMSYDEKEWHASIPSDKTDHNKTWILLVVFQWIKWSPSENKHVMKIMQSFQLFYPHPKLKCKNGSEYVQFKEKNNVEHDSSPVCPY